LRLLVILALLLPAFAVAEESSDDDMRLTVKPLLCITDNRNPSCDMSFLIVWQSIAAGYYCLFSDFTDVPMRCWNDERSGQLDDDRTVTQNFSYWMTGTNEGARLAEVNVEVLRLDSDDRRRRRRNRHVWDIN
jgi:hypothetical protein